jgi:catechol 2,3-dioxygenase-like lactoylglutathione lyase family enzyme
MLADARVEATVPVARLDLAREFYEGRLGLRPAGAHSEGVDVLYACGGETRMLVYEQGGPWTPDVHTVAHFVVDDVRAAVSELRDRGVVFEDYDLPELRTTGGVATVGEMQFAWFRDPDGNVLGLHD